MTQKAWAETGKRKIRENIKKQLKGAFTFYMNRIL